MRLCQESDKSPDWSWRGALDWHAGPRLSVAHVAASGDPRAGWSDVHQSENLTSIGARAGLGVPLGGAWHSAWRSSCSARCAGWR